MTVDELAVMDGSLCILQIRGERPFKSKKYDLTKHPNYKYITDFDPNSRFDVERHLSTELTLEGGDIYAIFDDSEPNYQ